MWTVLSDSTSYIVIIVLWMILMDHFIATARWWPSVCLKCVSGLRRLGGTWFFEMHLFLWPGAQKLFWHKWRKLATASLLLLCIDGYSCLGYWNEFFSSVFEILDWCILLLHFYLTVFNCNLKLIWTQLGFFWVFCWNMPRFVNFISVWTKICMNCSIVYSFLTTSNFFDS